MNRRIMSIFGITIILFSCKLIDASCAQSTQTKSHREKSLFANVKIMPTIFEDEDNDPLLTLDQAMLYATSLTALPKRAKIRTLDAIEHALTEHLSIASNNKIKKSLVLKITDSFIDQACDQLRASTKK